MAKRRMNAAIRDKLLGVARQSINPQTERDAVEAAYKTAEPLVRKMVQAKFPPRDMRVLKKYKAAFVDDCIKLELKAGGVEMFNFADDTGPWVAQKTRHGQIYQADAETSKAVAVWVAARDAYKEESKKRLTDYRSLLYSARNIEDVLEVWPEAAEHIPSQTQIISLSDAVVKRIKADMKERAA